ncbi:MAG: TIM barrel protein [Rhodospirillaceae bacterium]|nr:TIM barrel protein [Rhodospirillaceae bacterium]
MPRFSANISMLFTEAPLLERFKLAAACGFAGAECMFPYEAAAGELGDAVAMSGIPLVLFNAPPGDYAGGQRGLAALKGHERAFKTSLDEVLAYAEYNDCKQVHVMTGIVPEDEQPDAVDLLVKNLGHAGKYLASEGIRVLVENINLDGYMTRTPAQAAAIVRAVDHKNVKLLYDVFHAQTLEGNIAEFIENNLDIIGHIQVAGVPGRHEPDKLGEINWRFLFDLLDAHGYDGWVGAEYAPRKSTREGLHWGRDWGIGVREDKPKK